MGDPVLNSCHPVISAERVDEQLGLTWKSVCALLRKITGRGVAVPITLVMDNARYQRCALVQVTAKELGIERLYLPSYSQNLNLIERMWKFVKKEVLNSRHHKDVKKFQQAIDGCLAEMPRKHLGNLATLPAHNFQTWDNVSLLNASSITSTGACSELSCDVVE